MTYILTASIFNCWFHLIDLPANSIQDFLLPAIQNLLKDSDALDPAHREALEIIMKERSGSSFSRTSSTKVMGLSNFFGERGKKDSTEAPSERVVSPRAATSQVPAEDTRFRRIMLGHFGEILRGKGKSQEEPHSR